MQSRFYRVYFRVSGNFIIFDTLKTMAKIVKPLTDTQVRLAKAHEKNYKMSDGGGLYLLIKLDDHNGGYKGYRCFIICL